ncbi:MFS transporter [Bordetella sp. FB-8]|uniref:MFS transporter n=1 Tax=Bordetella sp. FB-8 TaxID=1159870 RepID=UPI00037C8F48|nr:MFS transporter [Bordetella sp. FB-8]
MASQSFSLLDEQKFKGFHWLALFTTGMGVFTDGYDLASIGVVLPLVLASFGIDHLTGFETSALAGSALVGAAVGALIFGALAQKGRKRYYGLDVMLMAVAALAQIFAPNLWSLIAIRFILGIGIGADYVLSPTIMAEHANRRDRGKKIGIGFGVMWSLGAVFAALLNVVLSAAGVSHDLQWRIVLAFGAVPALSVLYLRRKMPETARYLGRVAGDATGARAVVARITGDASPVAPMLDRRQWRAVFALHAPAIFSAALLWMLFDIVVYSGILFGPSLIAQGLGLAPTTFALLTSFVFTLPGCLIGVALIDRIGRKQLQAAGFALAALMLALFAYFQKDVAGTPLLGLFLFGLYSLTITAGPNTVAGTGILGVELSPTRVRTIGQSITVVGGRIGASISAFLFPLLFGTIGETGVIYLLACISVIGAICTLLLIPETASRSLEEINSDGDADLARVVVTK